MSIMASCSLLILFPVLDVVSIMELLRLHAHDAPNVVNIDVSLGVSSYPCLCLMVSVKQH